MGEACCFIGHRKINENEELKNNLRNIIERMVMYRNVTYFLFGSKSRFNDLCYEIVTEIKEKHPHIKRIYVRAEYAEISDAYKRYLLNLYEDTYYPQKIIGAGKAVYVERNFEMIKNSDFCVFYYNSKDMPNVRPSGTKIALDYALKQKKKLLWYDFMICRREHVYYTNQ